MCQPNCSKTVVGIDVGGANLKYAGARGDAAFSRHFAMWRHPQNLGDTIAADLQERFDDCAVLAVTMTGELADCFADRSEGVNHIADHVCRAAKKAGVGEVQFYGVDGQFRTARQARRDVDVVAAANWHALAAFVGKEIAADATLIDVGSTTTDIVPIRDRRVATKAKTDHERLCEGSLVYIGCRRTPVCALVDRLKFRDQESAVMNELFATIDDARLVLGWQADRPQDNDSADGRPRTRQMAVNRLARMIGLDHRDVSAEDASLLAEQILQSAQQKIGAALNEFVQPDSTVVISGHGDDLIDLPPCQQVRRLWQELGPEQSRCAPAYAVASLFQAGS